VSVGKENASSSSRLDFGRNQVPISSHLPMLAPIVLGHPSRWAPKILVGSGHSDVEIMSNFSRHHF